MAEFDWRDRAGALFECKKKPALGSRGMVVTNHPLASTAGMQMLAGGGNAFDAAIASLFALTVVSHRWWESLAAAYAIFDLPMGNIR